MSRAIDDGGTIVWESHSIIRYLAARYAFGAPRREVPAERSLADRWMDWELATLQPAFMDLSWGFYRTPEAKRDWPAIRAAVARCASATGASTISSMATATSRAMS